MKRLLSLAIVVGVLFCAGRLLAASGPVMSQKLVLNRGWNLFTLKVEPEEDVPTFFKDWPLVRVGEYDAETAQETVQFSPLQSSEGAVKNAWRLYVPGNRDISTLEWMSANATYLVLLTNKYSVTVRGTPVAARNSLQATTSNVLSYAQISLRSPTDTVKLVDYLNGFDSGKWTAYELYGDGDLPKSRLLTAQTSVTGDKTLAFSCSRASSWSGPLFVSPCTGIDFGTEEYQSLVEVRNDSALTRNVRLSLASSEPSDANQLPLTTNCWIRRSGAVGTNTLWRVLSADRPFDCSLVAGESASFEVALDRTAWADLPEERQATGLLHVDELGATHFRTTLPVQATVGGAGVLTNGWPNGLWQVEAALDRVSFVTAENGYVPELFPAGGTMKVRLLLQRSPSGVMYLLPRVETNGLCLTSAVLPLNRERLPNDGGSKTNDVETGFGKRVSFVWGVDAASPVNPFYHARHPDHDGLTADFKSRLPSGDNPERYTDTVKPELFSINNEVTLVWNASDSAVWNPAEMLTGTLSWRFTGLRREGAVIAEGPFMMRRLTALCPSPDDMTTSETEEPVE